MRRTSERYRNNEKFLNDDLSIDHISIDDFLSSFVIFLMIIFAYFFDCIQEETTNQPKPKFLIIVNDSYASIAPLVPCSTAPDSSHFSWLRPWASSPPPPNPLPLIHILTPHLSPVPPPLFLLFLLLPSPRQIANLHIEIYNVKTQGIGCPHPPQNPNVPFVVRVESTNKFHLFFLSMSISFNYELFNPYSR